MNWEEDTLEHIDEVFDLLYDITDRLKIRAALHDASKMNHPESKIFEIYTSKLKNTTYGSDEYKQYLKEMKPALDHHYANNRHHPEHFKNGINDMNLVDLIEMFCDWFAATERHEDGNIFKSIEINKKRFNYSDDLKNIFNNTAELFLGISKK